MKDLKKIKEILIKHKKFLKEKYDIKNIRIFGSYAKGKEGKDSDIDLIIEFYKTKSLMELVRIENILKTILEAKVDLLTEDSISPYMVSEIKNEAIYIYK